MREALGDFILENGGEEIDSSSWRMQTPKRVIPMEKVGDLLVSSLVVIENDGAKLKCFLPLGEIPGQAVAPLISDLVDLPARVDGRATLLVQPTEEGSVVLSLASSFYLGESLQEDGAVVAVLLSLLDSIADLVAEVMLRSDLAFQKGSKNLFTFLKEQASMSIVLEQAKKAGAGKVSLEKADLDIGKIKQELYDFTESLGPEERARLEALTEELKRKDPLSFSEEDFQEELHNVVSYPRIKTASEVARAEKNPYLIVIYEDITASGPIDYQYAWVIYDSREKADNPSWHSEDVQEFNPCVIITLEHGDSGSYIGLFAEGEHRNLFPSEGVDLEGFKELATPIAKEYLEQ